MARTVANSFFLSIFQPENLLLDANGTLKVSDFGLSALSKQVRVRKLTRFPLVQIDGKPGSWKVQSYFGLFCWFHVPLFLLTVVPTSFCYLVGGWAAAHHLWNSQLCCSRGSSFTSMPYAVGYIVLFILGDILFSFSNTLSMYRL
jgi:serine/threonine protein kinase